jgi:hypothetical protein
MMRSSCNPAITKKLVQPCHSEESKNPCRMMSKKSI